MNAIELIQRLERIVAEHGPAIQVEVRNVAGDRDYLDYVGVAFNSRVSVVQLITGLRQGRWSVEAGMTHGGKRAGAGRGC